MGREAARVFRASPCLVFLFPPFVLFCGYTFSRAEGLVPSFCGFFDGRFEPHSVQGLLSGEGAFYRPFFTLRVFVPATGFFFFLPLRHASLWIA